MRGSSGSCRPSKHTVGRDGGPFDGLRGQYRSAAIVEDIDHLLETGHFGINHVVGQDDSEGFVADKFLGAENGVSQAERFALADIADARKCRDAARDGEQFFFPAALQRGVEFEAVVEMVFHGAFAASGDDDDVLDAGGHRFFNSVLDDGLVDKSQHLFGYDFGGGEKASAEAASRKDHLAYLLCHQLSLN